MPLGLRRGGRLSTQSRPPVTLSSQDSLGLMEAARDQFIGASRRLARRREDVRLRWVMMLRRGSNNPATEAVHPGRGLRAGERAVREA
jgi:hypothetical protein